MSVSVDIYSDFIEKYLGELYTEYWTFELNRTDTLADQYKADKLLQVYNLVETCNSFFSNNVKTVEDFNRYINFLEELTIKGNYKVTDSESFVLGILTVKLVSLQLF